MICITHGRDKPIRLTAFFFDAADLGTLGLHPGICLYWEISDLKILARDYFIEQEGRAAAGSVHSAVSVHSDKP